MKKLLVLLATVVFLMIGCASLPLRDAERTNLIKDLEGRIETLPADQNQLGRARHYYKELLILDPSNRKYELEVEALNKAIFERDTNLTYTGVTHYCREPMRIHIGMSESRLPIPLRKNVSVGKWGTHKQYVYPGYQYVYTKDGKVTSWQHSE